MPSSNRNSDMMENRSVETHRHIRGRLSPHSSNYQDGSNQGNRSIIKSDSPSRKRRRLQRMTSQSPPIIWENINNQAINNINMNQPNQNSYHYHQNRRLSSRHYHNNNNGQLNSPPARRQRYRDQHQQSQPSPRPWDINPTSIFQQPSPPHHGHGHAHHLNSQHPLMVEMNRQVPVSLPLGHEQIQQLFTTYPGPHISICKNLNLSILNPFLTI